MQTGGNYVTAYYNEHDPYAAAWLRNLIAAGHIAPGVVDERSIEDVRPDELREFTQCHFFAGIGVWSYSLRVAGWPDDRPVWTGSCPCQPFSAAGAGNGFADERHLWPAWFHLIEQCRPGVIFGEQVEAAIRHGWLDLVQSDLEGISYDFGPVGIPAAGVGAPHIRQRLWFVADSQGERRRETGAGGRRQAERFGNGGESSGMADADNKGSQGRCGMQERTPECVAGPSGLARRMAGNQQRNGSGGQRQFTADRGGYGLVDDRRRQFQLERPGPTNGRWADADWLRSRDGKWRPVEPGTFSLAHGATNRVGGLRAYGNAIVPQVAKEVIQAYMSIGEEQCELFK